MCIWIYFWVIQFSLFYSHCLIVLQCLCANTPIVSRYQHLCVKRQHQQVTDIQSNVRIFGNHRKTNGRSSSNGSSVKAEVRGGVSNIFQLAQDDEDDSSALPSDTSISGVDIDRNSGDFSSTKRARNAKESL